MTIHSLENEVMSLNNSNENKRIEEHKITQEIIDWF